MGRRGFLLLGGAILLLADCATADHHAAGAAPPPAAPGAGPGERCAGLPSLEESRRELERQLHARFPDLTEPRLVLDLGMHITDVADADVDAAETFAVTGSEDGTARVWAPNDSGNTLGTVAWASDGAELFAAGRYSPAGGKTILRWSRDGNRLPDWRLFQNTPERMLGLRNGGLLVGAQDPLVGVLDGRGEVRWSHRAEVPNFTGSYGLLKTSPDTAVVEFAWDPGTTERIAFDVRRLAWTPAGLFAGTRRGEQALGLQGIAKDGSAQLMPVGDLAGLMRRPDLVAGAIPAARR